MENLPIPNNNATENSVIKNFKLLPKAKIYRKQENPTIASNFPWNKYLE